MVFILKKSLPFLLFSVLIAGCNEKYETVNQSTSAAKKEVVNNKDISEKKSSSQSTTNDNTNIQKTEEAYPQTIIQRQSSTATKSTIKNFDFNIIKKGFKNNNTLLIVGGIQGDEPGGFMAASLIATHYEITKGSVWVVPNLNFYSIIKRSRGPYGDMNRKFADLAKTDPEYETVKRIKSYINDERVKLIVNLHDGSGYYRPTYVDSLHSPKRWGQCSIIDQEILNDTQYSNLLTIANDVVSSVNENLLKDQHIYHLHNTRTNEGDIEMEKTLTYYAIKQGKAAFGNEASKNLPTHQRTYYHLLALEKYMDTMGIEYKRKFELNNETLKDIIDNDIEISLYNNKIKLPLSNIRNILNYFPVSKDEIINFSPSNPLMSIVKNQDEYSIYYGNRRLTRLQADYIDYDTKNTEVTLTVDNQKIKTSFGSVINVKDTFKVDAIKGYRVNVIGYTDKNNNKETDITIDRQEMMKRFSIDTDGSIYRIEFYAKEKFAGMILVKF